MSVHVNCANCGIEFCLPEAVEKRLRESHEHFYCPNGHMQRYPQETAKERKIRLLEERLTVAVDMLQSRDFRIKRLEHEVRSLRSRLAWAQRKREEDAA